MQATYSFSVVKIISVWWESLSWLRWMEGVNAEIKVVDEVKMKRCNGLHTIDTQVIDQNNIVID